MLVADAGHTNKYGLLRIPTGAYEIYSGLSR